MEEVSILLKRKRFLTIILLGKELIDNEITILWLTSALFTFLSEAGTEIFRNLKYLLSGGDVLSVPI